MKIDVCHVVKWTFIVYKILMGYKISVGQIRNRQRTEKTVYRFELHAPMNIRDEVFNKFKRYNEAFSGKVARLIHNFLLTIPGGILR